MNNLLFLLAAQFNATPEGNKLRGTCDGLPFTCIINDSNDVLQAIITLECRYPHDLRVARTHSPAPDDLVYETDDPHFRRDFMSHATRAWYVATLLQPGDRLTLGRQGARLELSRKGASTLDVDAVANPIKELAQLVKLGWEPGHAVATPPPSATPKRRVASPPPRVAPMSGCAGCLVVSLFGFVFLMGAIGLMSVRGPDRASRSPSPRVDINDVFPPAGLRPLPPGQNLNAWFSAPWQNTFQLAANPGMGSDFVLHDGTVTLQGVWGSLYHHSLRKAWYRVETRGTPDFEIRVGGAEVAYHFDDGWWRTTLNGQRGPTLAPQSLSQDVTQLWFSSSGSVEMEAGRQTGFASMRAEPPTRITVAVHPRTPQDGVHLWKILLQLYP